MLTRASTLLAQAAGVYAQLSTTRVPALRLALRRVLRRAPPHCALDLGAGLGELTRYAARLSLHHRSDTSWFALDRDAEACALLSRTARGLPITPCVVDLNAPDAALPQGPFEFILCAAMLQYVADDVGWLARLRAAAASGATLLLYAPVDYRRSWPGYDALMARHFAVQDYDAQAGICRRYTRAGLIATVQRAGWQITRLQAVTGPLGQLHYELHRLLLAATRRWGLPLVLLIAYLPLGLVLARLDHLWLQLQPHAQANGLLLEATASSPPVGL